jgi:hypothetical protein
MGAASKRAKKVRTESEFDIARLMQRLRMPRYGQNTIDSWSLEAIYEARNEQQLGFFLRPSRMAEAMRTDDALFVAQQRRMAPRKSIPVQLQAAQGARGEAIAAEAEALFGANGVGLTEETIASIHACLVDHGVAFGCIDSTPRKDGSRIDLELRYYPIEYLRWDAVYRLFRAQADPNTVAEGDLQAAATPDFGYGYGASAAWLPVVHGDGRWVIFKNYDLQSFRQDAAILPAALVWARHAFAMNDWRQGSKSHGSPKLIGELPEGVPLQNEAGLTAEASAFIGLLRAMAEENSPFGIRPAGATIDLVTNNSTAWQVWAELIKDANGAASRIYLGTDGTVGPNPTAPGVDMAALFGVETSKVTGDLTCLARGIDTGLIRPWCAINFGDDKLAPTRHWMVPNNDAEKITDDYAKRTDAFYKALVDAKEAGLTLTPEYISSLANDYRVRVPGLAVPPAPAPVKEIKTDQNAQAQPTVETPAGQA